MSNHAEEETRKVQEILAEASEQYERYLEINQPLQSLRAQEEEPSSQYRRSLDYPLGITLKSVDHDAILERPAE